MSSILQRFVIFFGIGWILSSLGLYITDFRWWAILILIGVINYIAMSDGESRGAGKVLSYKRETLIKLKDLIDAVDRGEDVSTEELDAILEKEKNE